MDAIFLRSFTVFGQKMLNLQPVKYGKKIVMFYQWYLTPNNIEKIHKNYKGTCWKYKEAEGTFYHMWWSCKKRKKYWRERHVEIQKIFKIKFMMKSETILLGILSDNTERIL